MHLLPTFFWRATFLMLFWLMIAPLVTLAQGDSLKLKTVAGKDYIVHKIGDQETLTKIAERYGVSKDEILEANPTIQNADNIQKGYILLIPYGEARALKESGSVNLEDYELVRHVVAKGETLTQISKTYQVPIDEIKKWNNLPDDKIKLGQELIVGMGNRKSANKNNDSKSQYQATRTLKNDGSGVHIIQPKETLYSIAKQYGTTVEQLQEWNNIANPADIKAGEQIYIASPEVLPTNEPDKVKTHVVRQGETLTQIAKKYGLSLKQLMVWNKLESETLKTGQELALLPQLPTGIVAVPYKVQEKDNLFQISEKFEAPMADIKNLNGLADDKVYKDQLLFVPVSATKMNTEPAYKKKIEDFSIQDIAQNGLPQEAITNPAVTTPNNNNPNDRVVTQPNATGKDREHIIDKGENMQKIAEIYGLTVEDIMLANPTLPHMDSIRVGRKLVIPAQSLVPKRQDNYPNGRVHVIARGENLGKIASQYPGVTPKAIMAHNNLSHPDSITVGKAIVIPPPNHPEGQPIDMTKVADVQYAKSITKNDKNPYLKDEYLKYLLPEGEDAIHDLARDYGKDDKQPNSEIKLDEPGWGEDEKPQNNTQQQIPVPQTNPNNNNEGAMRGGDPNDDLAAFTQADPNTESTLTLQPDQINPTLTEGTQPDKQEEPQNKVPTANSITTEQAIQQGLAEKMPIDGIDKNVCMHPFAKPGTVIQVKNTANPSGMPVYVRVVENYQTDGSDQVIIKLSEAAYRQLNPGAEGNQRFPVEVRIMNN